MRGSLVPLETDLDETLDTESTLLYFVLQVIFLVGHFFKLPLDVLHIIKSQLGFILLGEHERNQSVGGSFTCSMRISHEHSGGSLAPKVLDSDDSL